MHTIMDIISHSIKCYMFLILCRGALMEVGRVVGPKRRNQTWVQTERAAHEAWARLIARAPLAARLMHVLVAHMDAGTNAVVASQTTLGELMAEPGQKPVHRNTVRKAIATLEKERWIEVVRIGGKGGALAYVINERVAWAQARNKKRYAAFSARVLASETEQTEALEGRPELRQVPVLLRGEHQLPAGDGEEPPSQPCFDGMEPDLPAVVHDADGVAWEVDPETGELQKLISE